MKNIFKIIIFTIIICVSFSGCKKYPEDDRRYWFKSPIKRLSKPSSWDLNAYFINGADSISSLCYRYINTVPGLYTGKYIPFPVVGHSKDYINISTSIGSGQMKLVSNKNKLNITFNIKNGNYNPFINLNGDWDIKELTEKILKISATINGNSYEMVFNG